MKKQKILNYMKKIDENIKSGEYILFETALVLYLRSDFCDVEKLKDDDINDITKYISDVDSILNGDVIDIVEEKLGDVI